MGTIVFAAIHFNLFSAFRKRKALPGDKIEHHCTLCQAVSIIHPTNLGKSSRRQTGVLRGLEARTRTIKVFIRDTPFVKQPVRLK